MNPKARLLQNHRSQLKYRIKTHRDLRIIWLLILKRVKRYTREHRSYVLNLRKWSLKKKLLRKNLATAKVSYIHKCDEFSLPLLWKAAWSANKWSLLSLEVYSFLLPLRWWTWKTNLNENMKERWQRWERQLVEWKKTVHIKWKWRGSVIILSFPTPYAEINVHIWDVILSLQYWRFSASGRERIDRLLTKKTPASSPSKKTKSTIALLTTFLC